MMQAPKHLGRLVPVIGMVALLAGCGEPVSSIEVAEDDLNSPSERHMSVEEHAQQQAKVRSISRCLGLIEAVANLKTDEMVNRLKAQGIDQSASELIPLVLQKATEVELGSGLPEAEINEIIEESKVRLETSEQPMSLLSEIKGCFETHKPMAESPVYSSR